MRGALGPIFGQVFPPDWWELTWWRVDRGGAVALLSTVLLLAAACGPGGEEDVARGDDDAEAGHERSASPPCLGGEAWIEDGPVVVEGVEREGGNGPDPYQVSDLQHEAHDGCEQVTVELVGEDGAPAALPGRVEAEVLRSRGVVRVSLPDVPYVDFDATDRSFTGELVNQAYVLWSDEGRWIDVDLHLAQEAEIRVGVREDPGQIKIDLRPGGGSIPAEAVRGQRVVVLEPRPGEASYPMVVSGYARTFEAQVVGRLEQEGEVVADTFTTATAWADAWGHFRLVFEEGPSGSLELHVGEHSARDGSWEGVRVELTVP